MSSLESKSSSTSNTNENNNRIETIIDDHLRELAVKIQNDGQLISSNETHHSVVTAMALIVNQVNKMQREASQKQQQGEDHSTSAITTKFEEEKVERGGSAPSEAEEVNRVVVRDRDDGQLLRKKMVEKQDENFDTAVVRRTSHEVDVDFEASIISAMDQYLVALKEKIAAYRRQKIAKEGKSGKSSEEEEEQNMKEVREKDRMGDSVSQLSNMGSAVVSSISGFPSVDGQIALLFGEPNVRSPQNKKESKQVSEKKESTTTDADSSGYSSSSSSDSCFSILQWIASTEESDVLHYEPPQVYMIYMKAVAMLQGLRQRTLLGVDRDWLASVKNAWDPSLTSSQDSNAQQHQKALLLLDMILAAFVYTVDAKRCDCETLEDCQQRILQDASLNQKHRKKPKTPNRSDVYGSNGTHWAVMNACLRMEQVFDSLDKKEKEKETYDLVKKGVAFFKPLSDRLNQGLKIFPHVRRVVFRGIHVNVAQKYKIGSEVTFAPFTSTSLEGTEALKFMGGGGTYFILKTFSAASIQPFSHFPEQEEALLSTNTDFIVDGKFSKTLLQMLHNDFDIVLMSEKSAHYSAQESMDCVLDSLKMTNFVYEKFLKTYVEGRVGDVPYDEGTGEGGSSHRLLPEDVIAANALLSSTGFDHTNILSHQDKIETYVTAQLTTDSNSEEKKKELRKAFTVLVNYATMNCTTKVPRPPVRSYPLFRALEFFLRSPVRQHMLLLGDGGSGKTSATLACLSHLPCLRFVRPVVPIFLPLPTVQSVFQPLAIDQHIQEMLRLSNEAMALMHKKTQVVLLLDSLDETDISTLIGNNSSGTSTSALSLDTTNNKSQTTLSFPALLSASFNPWTSQAKCIVSCRREFLEYHQLTSQPSKILVAEAVDNPQEQKLVQVYYVHPFNAEDREKYLKLKAEEAIARLASSEAQRWYRCMQNIGLSARQLHQPCILHIASTVLAKEGVNEAASGKETVASLYEKFLMHAFPTDEADLKTKKNDGPGGSSMVVFEQILDAIEEIGSVMLQHGVWSLPCEKVHTAVQPYFKEKSELDYFLRYVPCRCEDVHDGKAEFSFWHKSLAEFVIARRIAKRLTLTSDDLERKEDMAVSSGEEKKEFEEGTDILWSLQKKMPGIEKVSGIPSVLNFFSDCVAMGMVTNETEIQSLPAFQKTDWGQALLAALTKGINFDTVDFPYRIGKQIAQDSGSKTYSGYNLITGLFLSVKQLITGTRTGGKAQLKDLRSEVLMLKKLQHENIIKYFGYTIEGRREEEKRVSIVMEYLPQNLSNFSKECGGLTMPLIAHYSKQILSALACLHQQKIVHRDMKGSNILISSQSVVKLANFGLSIPVAMTPVIDAPSEGQGLWMAPEVIQGGISSMQADIWAFGCILIELLTGDIPYKELKFSSTMEVMFHVAQGAGPKIPEEKSVPDSFKDFFESCVKRNPAERLTAQQLLQHRFLSPEELKILTANVELVGHVDVASTAHSMVGSIVTMDGVDDNIDMKTHSLAGSGSIASTSSQTSFTKEDANKKPE